MKPSRYETKAGAPRDGIEIERYMLRQRVGAQDKGRFNVNPFKFLQEVRQETSKVTWPTRNETWVTTIAVLIMVTLASLFFMLADQLMGWVVSSILALRS